MQKLAPKAPFASSLERLSPPCLVRRVLPLVLIYAAANAAIAQVASQPASAPSPASQSAAATPKPQPAAVVPPASKTTAPAEPEVVGFLLQGAKPWQKFKIPDLDMLPVGNERYIPLRRILDALGIKYTLQNNQLIFTAAKDQQVTIDANTKRLVLPDGNRDIALVEMQSPITRQTDIFVPVALVDELMGLKSEWKDQDYQFVSKTDRVFPVWNVDTGPSLLAMLVKEVPHDLPEMFTTAEAPRNSIDFIEIQARTRGQLLRSGTQTPFFNFDSMEESFWGSLEGGRYKVTLDQPSISYDINGWKAQRQPATIMKWGDIVFSNDTSELAIGDSTYGLSDLIFPYVRMTGVRYNGIFNADNYVKAWDQSGLGIRRFFGQVEEFQGFADVGSKAELYINDRLVAQDEVLTGTNDAPLGQGVWRFKDIQIPTGARNDVRIVVTPPNGIRQQIDRSIMGSSFLLPENAYAVLAGAGVNRDSATWNARGFMTGTRVLYGVSPTLTIGSTIAFQDAFSKPLTADPTDKFFRQFPLRTEHGSAEFTWVPFSMLVVNGEFAGVVGEDRADAGGGSFGDAAVRLQADMAPTDSLTFHGSLFRYGSDYFNGISTRPRDSQGAIVSSRWKITPQWIISGSAGEVVNNLDGRLDQTTRANFESARILTTAIWHTNLSIEWDRIGTNTDPGLNLYTFSLDSSLPWELDFSANIAIGDAVNLSGDPDFFSGLNVPDLPLFQSPSKSLVLRKALFENQTLAASYQEGSQRKRLTLIHNARFFHRPWLALHTEIGEDINTQQPFLDNRVEWVLNATGQTRVGVETKLEADEWSVLVYINLDELFVNDNGRIKRVSDRSFIPDYGAVKGHVFRDINANGKHDDGEKGIADIKILTPSGEHTITDDDGFFMVQTGVRPRQDRVYLDVSSVPADLSPVHAIQNAKVAPRTITNIDFAACPLHTISGKVLENEGGRQKPLSGIHVFITKPDDTTIIADSFTATDGSYYIGNVRPGNYRLNIDPKSIPENAEIKELVRDIVIAPKEESQEVKPEPFIATPVGATTEPATQPTTQPSSQPASQPATQPDTIIHETTIPGL